MISKQQLIVVFMFVLTVIGANMSRAVAAPPFTAAEPRIPISELPFQVTTPGSYYLTSELTDDGSGAIAVDTDNVTIDLMGFSLTGTGVGDGILLNGRKNVEIRNGTIRLFENGIRDTTMVPNAVQGYRIFNVRAVDNVSQGIWLPFADVLVKDCTANNNGLSGILVGAGSMVRNNVTNDNGQTGILADHGSTITGNIAHENGLSGVRGKESATIAGNTARNNGDTGVIAGPYSTVSGNTANGNGQSGISASIYSTVIGNTANTNGQDGIFVDRGSTIKNNTTSGNQVSGINLNIESLIDGNTAYENDQSGGGFPNIENCPTCTYGLNHAP